MSSEVKRFPTGGPGKKQCPNCKGDYFANAVKVCPDCNKPFKQEDDLPGQQQLPLAEDILPEQEESPVASADPQPEDQAAEQPPTVKDNEEKKKPRVKSEIVKVFTMKDLMSPPDASLTIEQMADYMRGQLKVIGGYQKKLAIHTYFLGEALVTTKEQFKEEGRRDFGKYLEDIGISPATATRARQLYDLVESSEILAEMTVTEAYRAFGILQPPKQLTDEKSEDEEGGTEEAKAGKNAAGEAAHVEQPEADDEADDSDVNESDVIEGEAAEVQSDKPEESSDAGEVDEDGSAHQPSGDKQPQPELKVALEDVTEDEMNAFTDFVEAAGTLERAKAVFKTCVKAHRELDAD